MTSDTTLQVRIGIPHFFRETAGGSGYGSGRPGQRLARCLALSRCLGSLLGLNVLVEGNHLAVGVHTLPVHASARAQDERRLETAASLGFKSLCTCTR